MSERERQVVEWLLAISFPFDWHTSVPAPGWLKQPLAEAWAKKDNESVENYIWALEQETQWSA